jgi:UDP-glucose 4-epimerase
MTHYLITGGAGFIGSHLAELQLARGEHVTVVDDLSTGCFENIAPLVEHPRFRFALDTITNEVVMDRLVSECDTIVHLAAAVGVELILNDPVRGIETNVLGTHAVLKVAARYRKKVLVASTSEIYGKSDRVPFAEDQDRVLGATTVARWSYSTSKAVDEFLALAYHQQMGLPVVIFRLFNTVGPRQTGRYGMVVPRLVQQALAGEPLTVYGDGNQSRCFLHVHDAVRAIASLASCPEAVGQVFNVGSTTEISILSLARRVLAVSTGNGDERQIHFVPYAEAYGPGFEDMQRRVPDVSRIQRVTGWRAECGLDQILADVAAYHKAQTGGS